MLSLTDYAAMYAILEPAVSALDGRVLVNLSSDTPEEARKGAAWAAKHGARHLTGGVQTPPSGIGSTESGTYYSGPRDLFEEYEGLLKVLTDTDHRGEDPGLAALYYQLQMDLFWTTLTAWLHMAALADANGIGLSEIKPYATETLTGMGQFLDFYTPRIEAGSTAATSTGSRWPWRASTTSCTRRGTRAWTRRCPPPYWRRSGARRPRAIRRTA